MKVKIVSKPDDEFQKFVQTYSNPIKELDFVVYESKSIDNAQLIQEWESKQQEVIEKAREIYEWAISKGIPKEQARSVLVAQECARVNSQFSIKHVSKNIPDITHDFTNTSQFL